MSKIKCEYNSECLNEDFEICQLCHQDSYERGVELLPYKTSRLNMSKEMSLNLKVLERFNDK